MKVTGVQVVVTDENCDPGLRPTGRTVTCNNTPCPPAYVALFIIIICDKNSVHGFYFASCMNIIFNELRTVETRIPLHAVLSRL